jgi:uncharacterized membrane protein
VARPVNVGPAERVVSAAAGGALVLAGASIGSWKGILLGLGGGSLLFRGVTGYCGLYARLGVNTARPAPGTSVRAGQGVRVDRVVTINWPAHELYHFWRELTNLPKIMSHIESIETGNGRSHWAVQGPLGTRLEWDAEIINERENELIAWRSVDGADVDTAGSVHFAPAPGGRGTEVRVELKYDTPIGKAGILFSTLLGRNPATHIDDDLRRFKQMMEAGEIPTTAGQPSGRREE